MSRSQIDSQFFKFITLIRVLFHLNLFDVVMASTVITRSTYFTPARAWITKTSTGSTTMVAADTASPSR